MSSRAPSAALFAFVVSALLPDPHAHAQAPHDDSLRVELGRAVHEGELDADRDGLPDDLERRTHTDPLSADTDRDGIPDGDEDVNRDGRVSAGETDPRRAGLAIGSAPHIPEPLSFDLVRGLGAHAGELETNVLVTMRPRRSGAAPTTWAPEVEWAFADGLALELELPMVDREVHAVKAAFQWTIPAPGDAFTHGVQLLYEQPLHAHPAELAALYLAGGRFGRLSLFVMAGLRAAARQSGHRDVLLNPSVFFDPHEAVTLGVEGNIALGWDGRRAGLTLAQVHWQVVPRFRIQLGTGAEFDGRRAGALIVTRLILE